MKQLENAVLRECLTACSHRRIQILDPRMWNKFNPPPLRGDDPAISGVAWRVNTGAARYGRQLVHFGLPGQPDIQGILKGGAAFAFECKSEQGKTSVYQKWNHAFFSALGVRVAVVRSYQDTIACLDSWGVK